MSSFFQEAITWDIPQVIEYATLLAARFSTILWFVVAITVVTKAITYLSGLLMGGSQPAPPGQVISGGGSTGGDQMQLELLSDIRSELKQAREDAITSGRTREFKFPRGRRRR